MEKKAEATTQWTMSVPVPVEFGAGCVAKLSSYVKGFRRALVVTGRHAMKATGVASRLHGMLKDAGLAFEVYDGVSPDPEHSEVEEAGALAKKIGAEVVIGCGGGSAMDAAKAAAVVATHDGPIMEYRVGGSREITSAVLPIMAISTTSGTGSHVGRAAIISDRARGMKSALISDFLYPRAAICDSEILSTMPPEVTAASGFDAFSHALEGYLSSVENPMGNLCAKEAMRIIVRTLPEAVSHGDRLDLRSRMAWADTLAGISLATNAITTPHAVAMVVGGRYGVTHGRALAAVTPAWLRHARNGAVGKLANVARLLGCQETKSDEELADWAIEAIERLIQTIGLEKKLTEYGVPSSEFEEIAAQACESFGFRIQADPVPPEVSDLAGILTSSVRC